MINLIGCLTADLIMAQINDKPDFGEEYLVDDLIIRPGALANIIFPLSKLGIKQNVISLLGEDEFGENLSRITAIDSRQYYKDKYSHGFVSVRS